MEEADAEDLRSSLEEVEPRVVKEEKLGFTPGRADAALRSALCCTASTQRRTEYDRRSQIIHGTWPR